MEVFLGHLGSLVAVGFPLGVICQCLGAASPERVNRVPVTAAYGWCGLWDLGDERPPVCFQLQLYTLSQDGALCVWQCDTAPEGLRLKAPTGWKADLLQREEEEEEEEGEQETTIRGKATPASEEQKGKVKYSRLAK